MADLSLTKLAGASNVIKAPTTIGLIQQPDNKVVLIDTGNDDDAGKRILKVCEGAGFSVALIANTHSNADHCGGNALIRSRTGCVIAAPRTEVPFIEHPELEPSLIWGGNPPPPLRNKFLMAKPSVVDLWLQPPCELADTGIKVIALPGHYVGQVGFITPDRVLFAGDAAASPAILAKYRYYVVFDVAAHLETLDMLASLDVDWIVASHAQPTDDAQGLVAANKATILEVGDRILGLCGGSGAGSSIENLIAALADQLGLDLNHTQYALLGMTLRSYVSWLAGKNEVRSVMEHNRFLIERL